VVALPTAVQTLTDVQDTPVRSNDGGPEVLWILQLVPFQTSASGCSTLLPVWEGGGVPSAPTAAHASGDVHETAFMIEEGRVGVLWTDQLKPFQASASVYD
jgi:hypothetical protein